jgi:outer membrane lipoprotein-sorting protein
MVSSRKVVSLFVLAIGFLAVRPAPAADDLNAALRRLDTAAVKFKSAEAEIVWDNVQTQPILDKDTQLGTAIFQRKAGLLSVALHIKSENGRPVTKEVVYTEGAVQFYEPLMKRLSVYKAGKNSAEFDSMLTLGFGASGKDLEKSWIVTLGGVETINGTATTRLELLPRDESVKKNVAKVTLWLDLDRGIAVKQRFDDPSGNYREVLYKNLKLNTAIPSDAFQLKIAPGTAVQNH